ncbi:MAG TPA: hypothetical protein VF406_03530 [Thermodesulfobacteriota bacterium]
MRLAPRPAMPYWVLALVVAAVVAVALFTLAVPLAFWVLPAVLLVIAIVGVVRAVQGRQSPREERRS